MIILTKLGGKQILMNENMIESAVESPDTIITLSNGHSIIVQESMEEILDKVLSFNRNSRRTLSRRGDVQEQKE